MQKALLVAMLAASLAASAADDRFHKKTPDSMMGFLAVKDALYLRECGTCHFAYSPGLLPARSWKLHLDRMKTGKHFGESVQLAPDARARIEEYLTRNAADVSPYEGSKTLMERISQAQTPYRLSSVPLFKEMHTVIWEVINVKNKVKVRTLANCNACHKRADDGSFGNDELYIPGLTGP